MMPNRNTKPPMFFPENSYRKIHTHEENLFLPDERQAEAGQQTV